MDTRKKYINSPAFLQSNKDSKIEFVNMISGRAYSLSPFLGEFINFCKEWRSSEDLDSFLSQRDLTNEDKNDILEKLLNNKLLLTNTNDIFVELSRNRMPFFNLGFSSYLKTKSKTVLLGIPYGNGNSFDNRCKDFPSYLGRLSSTMFPKSKLCNDINSATIHPHFISKNVNTLFRNEKIADVGDIFVCTGDNTDAISGRITSIISVLQENGCLPVIIGGDHSITFPIVKALSEKKNITIFHFDAHSDSKGHFYDDMYTSIGCKMLNHSIVMKRCSELKNINQIIQFGVREPFPDHNDLKFKSVSLEQIRNGSQTFHELDGSNNNIYISFDIDFFDPSIAPGTATKLINGAMYDETLTFLSKLLRNKNVVGLDIVEINPHLDYSNMTSQLAINLLLHILSLIHNGNEK